jgi:hypothetical protein
MMYMLKCLTISKPTGVWTLAPIPGKLYELLPYLYSIAGVVMINYFESIIGDTFGLLLYLLAGLIFLKRSNYRQDIVNKIN